MDSGGVLRHPKGLFLLFFTEMWERFGFYTLQTILVLYMSQSLLYSDEKTYLLYGIFGSLIYFTPVVGGLIADRLIGFRRSIEIGGVLYIIGYTLTALPYDRAFFFGLSMVILANGFFKPNVSSIVGDLYSQEDPRRDSGFTIFYMGINLGSLLPPLMTGFLVTHYGWHWGFLLAAVGMSIGMLIFWSGKKSLGAIGDVPPISPMHQSLAAKRRINYGLIVGIILCLFLIHFVFYFPMKADLLLLVASILVVVEAMHVVIKKNPDYCHKMVACLILMLFAIIFWAFYSQTFTSLMLFASRNMNQRFLGLPIDPEFTQFFNPFFILMLSPLLSSFWIRMNRKHITFSTPLKFSFGVLFAALGFLFLSGATMFFSSGGMLSPWWLAGHYFFLTIGELLLSPIGLAMVTQLAPPHYVGMLMGVWFLMQSIGFLIGSLLSTLADVPSDAFAENSMAVYSHAFMVFGLWAMAAAVGCLMLIPYLKKLILNK